MFNPYIKVKKLISSSLDIKCVKIVADTERKLRIMQLQNQVLSSVESGIVENKYCEHDVIISLTSYGKRIYDVHLTIESLMQQTVKPNKIILWLSEDEFTPDNIPLTLKKLEKRGLTIEFCKDIRSYTKLVPALRKYPDDIIITVDDDIIYQFDLIENLLNSYKEDPKSIHFCRGHRMKIVNNVLLSYYKWNWFINDFNINKLNFPTGVGGVLYPPHSLYFDVTDEKKFLSLAPFADDVWFKAMALLQGTLSKKVFTRSSIGEDYIDLISEIQMDTALFKVNILKNDEQIKAVFEKYSIYELLN